jgi:hydroxymethylpyrimidine/phosphomethylpyrimidine kinase
MSRKQVLTIAGSDSGGGAGIQADIKTFQERGVFGMSVLTAITAQNTTGVQDVHAIPLDKVQAQLDSIFSDFDVTAIKTGMLVNGEYMELIAKELKKHSEIPLVIDPVMIAKGGHPLMEESAVEIMKKELVPLATVITPNIPEAEALTGLTIKNQQDMEKVAKILQELGSKHVVIKGGHALEEEEATDLLLLENGESVWLKAERIDTKDTHGTGCTYSACIAAEIGKGEPVEEAVRTGKAFIHAAIKHGINVGNGHGPTNHWAYREEA